MLHDTVHTCTPLLQHATDRGYYQYTMYTLLQHATDSGCYTPETQSATSMYQYNLYTTSEFIS